MEQTKEYLEEVRTADKEIDSKTRMLEKMKSQLYSIQSSRMKEDVGSGGKKVTSEDRILRTMEYEKELIGELMDLLELKAEARRGINKIDKGVYRTVLCERYINNDKWENVANFMGYTVVYVQELNKKAIYELSKVPMKYDVIS